jgi:CHASE3 domain sensor protein
MLPAKRSEVFAANRRGAYVLGALLAAIVGVAIAISIRIYTQLDSAVTLQRTLVAAQQDLDSIVESQILLQNGVRGYVATGDREFLEPSERSLASFDLGVARFSQAMRSVHIERMDAPIKEMRDVHASWVDDVAIPLMHDRLSKDAKTRQTLGKIYVDQLHGDTNRVQDLLEDRLREAQAELKRRIDEGLFGGIGSVVVFGLVSIVFVTSRAQMQDVIDRERTIVETLGGAFRTDLEMLPGLRVGAAYLSADRDAAVGGDLYDVRRIDARRGLVLIADVSGKGIDAAVNTAFVKYSIRTLARHSDDPAQILAEFNRMFLETVLDPNLFVVVFVAIYDGGTRELTYASAGHSGAYIKRDGVVKQLDVTGPIVGLDASFAFERRTIRLSPRDMLLLSTDGLGEARDAAGDLLGDDGAMALFGSSSGEPQICADDIVSAVRERGGGTVHDDLAILAILAVDDAC